MTTTAMVTMIVICGVVWGGFAALLAGAVRSESRKRDGGESHEED
jgi:hypothetical protein